MLVDVTFGEVDSDIGDVTFGIPCGGIDGVEEALVGRQIEFGIPLTDLFMKRLIHLHRVGLDHLFSGRIIAFGGDALDFRKQFAVEAAQSFVVIDLQVVLAVPLDDLHFFVRCVSEHPVGDELTVPHMCFFDILTFLDADELGNGAVHNLMIVAGFVGIVIGKEA